jgi:hypothetical protein
MTETNKEKLLDSDYIDLEKWRNLCLQFSDLIHLDCLIKCPLKSSTSIETDFVRIIANTSCASERSIDIQLDHTNMIKNDVSAFSIAGYGRVTFSDPVVDMRVSEFIEK